MAEMSVRVYYEDTDAGGVVYNANYLKFMERGRTEMLRSIGFEQDQLMKDKGIIFVIRRQEIDYVKPAKFNDLLTVKSQVTELKKASMVFKQTICLQHSDTVLSKGLVNVVCVDSQSFRPTPIPSDIYEKIQHD